LLGILLTPPLTVLISGAQAEVGVGQLLIKLGSTVVVPLACGQLGRKLGVPKSPKWLGKGILIAIIWHAFSETFSHPVPVDLLDVASVMVCIGGIQVLLILLVSNVAIWTQQPRPDVVALGFTCSHKSLTLGMPILMALYGESNDFILYMLPLLVYHPMQIILGSVLFGPIFKVWINAGVVHVGTGGDGLQLKTMPSGVASVKGGLQKSRFVSFFGQLTPSRRDSNKGKATNIELLV
jgi:sodium/bile acid cotransporter 7